MSSAIPTVPSLSGVASKDLVEKIGTGKFQASYINWSRTLNLLRESAPGWLVDFVPAEDGGLLHKAPVGGYLLIKFRHMETGAETPAVPQAVMDHRNNAITWDKITARDITDTQRRGACLAAAFHFGLAYELWAKMPLESGYAESVSDSDPKQPTGKTYQSSGKIAAVAEDVRASEGQFEQIGLDKGLLPEAIESLKQKVKGDWASGIQTLNSKNAKWVDQTNEQFQKSEAY